MCVVCRVDSTYIASIGRGGRAGGGKTVKRRPREVVKRYVRYLKASGLCGSVLGFSVGWLIVSCVLCVFRWSENITSRASQFKPYNPIMTTTTLMMMANLTYIIVTTAHPARSFLLDVARKTAIFIWWFGVVFCTKQIDRARNRGGGVCGLSIRLEGPHSVGPTVARKKVRRQEQINWPF